MTAQILSMEAARARRAREIEPTVSRTDAALCAWFSDHYRAVMLGIKLPKERETE